MSTLGLRVGRIRCLVAVVVCAVCVSGLFAAGALAAGGGFGIESFEVAATERPSTEQESKHEPGAPEVQAGAHPYALTTSFTMNRPEELKVGNRPFKFLEVGGGLKDVQVELPPGFVGNPNAVPKCRYRDFLQNKCPDDTAVGVATTGIASSQGYISPISGERMAEIQYFTNPLYNVEPAGGIPAEFGFWAGGNLQPIFIDAHVRTGADYGVTVGSTNITQLAVIVSAKVTVWGVPAEASHDHARGKCLSADLISNEQIEEGVPHDEEESFREAEEAAGVTEPKSPVGCPVDVPVQPFLTNPTSCGTAREARISVDSWSEPGSFVERSSGLPVLSGCGRLSFGPAIEVSPDGSAGSTPTGLNVGVHVSQESTSNPVGLGEADVRDTTVTLPEGVQLSPAAADGLQSCPLLHGREAAQEERERKHEVSGIDLESAAPADCPDASKVATVRIKTPLLEHELEGAVYLASPQNFAGPLENPFGSLFALYLVAEEPETGVLVKLAGRVSPDERTGQLTSTFENTPQLPFEELKLEFFGTDRAPLATPARCGTYTTTAAFTPWSASGPPSGAGEVRESSTSFDIASGPGGSACPGVSLPFSPSLTTGSTNVQAGAFSPFTMTMSREDGQQSLQSVRLRIPGGLSGILTGVKLCGEAQADAGTCGPESLIGETTVSVGLGNDPFTVTGGKVYLTEGFEGAPFGLSIVNPAKAGPFVLQEGRPVVVRAKIEVDPHTAALTVTSATGAHGIPTIIDGVPLEIKHVNVTINRPGFTFNPTSCNQASVAGTIGSAEGASAGVLVPFQVTNCAALKFQPAFSVSTAGKTSKADGASLTATVTYPNGSQGTEADIASVKVELPKQLPSRLTTLQKACTQAQFQANPAGCPAASVIGHAVVHTQLLPVPLEGPAYFVSNGGEAFPNLIMVLQGYGVTIDLVGDTFISKAGITSTTFKAVPDQPFQSFELTLPQGPYSALAANGNLCALTSTKVVSKKVTIRVKGHKRTVTRKVRQTMPASLVMPNEFVAQNGATIKQNTTIAVTGCPKTMKKAPPKKAVKRKRAGHGKGRPKK